MITVHVHVPIINSPMSNVPIMRMFNVAGAKELQGAGVPRAAGGRTQRPGHRLSRVQGPVVVIMIFPFYLVIESLSDN